MWVYILFWIKNIFEKFKNKNIGWSFPGLESAIFNQLLVFFSTHTFLKVLNLGFRGHAKDNIHAFKEAHCNKLLKLAGTTLYDYIYIYSRPLSLQK